MTIRTSTGLRNKVNGVGRATIHAAIAANTISFDNGTAEIRDSGNAFISSGFLEDDSVYAYNTVSNSVTPFTVTSVAAGVMVVSPAPTDEAAGTVFVLVAASGGSLKDVMRNCVVKGYSGSQPATADSAVGTATLLVQYTNDGGTFTPGSPDNGLNFQDSSDGSMNFPLSDETPKGIGLADGTIGWFRICGNAADNGLASTTLPRIDMAVSTASTADAVGSTSVETGKYYYLNTSNLNFPYQYGA